MAKSSSRKNSRPRTTAKMKRRKQQRQPPQWLPWAIGGAALVAIVVLAWVLFLRPDTSGTAVRDHEEFKGVMGSSYDAGATKYVYPDPGQKGDGHKWLPALGAEGAPVVVIEFSDIFCGHCRMYNLNSLEGILNDYVAKGKVRYVDHYFGFDQAVQAGVAEAEMCAAEQGRYFEFKHALFQTVEAGAFDLSRGAQMAGLDMKQFNTCRNDQRYLPASREMVSVDNMGVNATPTFFVNGQKVEGNKPDEIRRMIDEALTSQ